jgi:hypothetical protein
MYDDLRAFCLFMGYTRSGHSLVGACLDAHPEAAIAHEGKIFEYDDEGKRQTGQLLYTTREDLIGYLVHRSARQAAGKGRRGTRLINGIPQRASYAVPGGHQGSCERLRVVGNKSGQESPMLWERHPGVFSALEELAEAPIRFLHVYRNPWDNIASQGRVHGDMAVPRYFRRSRIIREFKATGAYSMLDVRFEALVADPGPQLRTIFAFYGLSAPDDLVAACAAMIEPTPNPSRHTREWSSKELGVVPKRMREFEWLQGYPDTPD